MKRGENERVGRTEFGRHVDEGCDREIELIGRCREVDSLG